MQNLLFSDESAPGSARASGADLSLRIEAPELAPAQLRFNKLIETVERLTQRLAETQALADAFWPLYNSTLQPLVAQRTAVLRQLVLWLDARVQQAGLSPAVLRDTQAMVCVLSEGLGLAGDVVMRAVHDRHSAHTLADKEQAAAAVIEVVMQRMTGVDTSDLHKGESMQDVLHPSKPRSAAHIKAHSQLQDALGALRAIYRQLASALHPDRERDAGERARKTVLMGQANDAYARRDLMALLTLQLRCVHVDATALSRLRADKMAALTLLLQQQATAAEEALLAATERVHQEFALAPPAAVTEAGLMQALGAQALDLADALALMQQDLAAVQTDGGLKRWIKLQKKTAAANHAVLNVDARFR